MFRLLSHVARALGHALTQAWENSGFRRCKQNLPEVRFHCEIEPFLAKFAFKAHLVPHERCITRTAGGLKTRIRNLIINMALFARIAA